MIGPQKIAGYDTGRLGVLNPANLITFSRLLLGIFTIIAFELGTISGGATIILLIIAAASDLDGFVARALDCSSELGRALDPLIDKLFLAVVGTWSLFKVDFDIFPAHFALIFSHFLVGMFVLFNKKVWNMKPTKVGKTSMALTLPAVIFALHDGIVSGGANNQLVLTALMAANMFSWLNTYRAYTEAFR